MAWSIRYLHIPLLYFVYLCTYLAEARPTGSKLPCEDGCKHIHLVLGADNHLIPRWTVSRARDTSEKALLGQNHPVSIGELGANFEHRILGSNLGRQVLVLDARSHLVPIRSAIHHGDGAGKVLSSNIRKDVRDETSEDSLVCTVLDIENNLVPQRIVTRRGGAGDRDKYRVFILNKDSHVVPLRHAVHLDEPDNGVYPQTLASNIRNHIVPPAGLTRHAGADRFLVLNSFSHLVPVRQSEHCCDKAKEVHFINTESHLPSRQQAIHRDEIDTALFLDTDSHLVPLRNFFHIGNQAVPLRRIIRRAEPDDGVSTDTVGPIELNMQQVNTDTENPEPGFADEVVASPELPLLVSEDSDSGIEDANNYSATLDPGDLTSTAEGTNIPSFISPEPTELAVEALPPQETESAAEVLFTQEAELAAEALSSQETELAADDLLSQEIELATEALSSQETELAAEVLFSQETELTADDLLPQKTELATEALSPQETEYGDYNSAMIAFGETRSPSHGYPKGIGCFACVLRVAVGLSITLAMTSLLLLCCLSRRGQYIWINTINIVGTQNPISQQEIGQENRRNDPEPGDGSGEDIGRSATGSQHDPDNLNRSSVSGQWSFLPRGWITLGRGAGASANQGIPTPDKPGIFQRWFGPNSIQTGILKGPGFFQRWFGWRGRKHVNFDDVPLRSSRNGPRIRSVRARESPDPSVILTEVAERLVQERMRQLSTILSIAEDEQAQAAIVASAEELETPSMSSIRAVATGSTMGTQRRDNTVRRSRRGALKTFNDMDGVATSLPVSATDDSTQNEMRGEELVGGDEREPTEKYIYPVRFDDKADSTKGKGRGIFGRTSIKKYLFPTLTDGGPPAKEASTQRDTVDANDFVEKERNEGGTAGDPREGMFNAKLDDSGNSVSASSTLSGATGTELKRQFKAIFEVGSSESGSSIGDDSTLIVGSDDNIESALVVSVEEERRPRSRGAVAASGFAMGSDLVLSRPMRIRSDTRMREEVLGDKCGVSAFGLRAKSPRSSIGDSELGDGEFSSGYFTESSGGNDNMEGEPESGSFHPVDPIRGGADFDGEINMRGVLGGKLGAD